MTLRRPSFSRRYLLGAWQDVWVDPTAWAVGTQPVSHYLVKSAARRVLLLGLRARDSGFSMVHAQSEAVAGGVGKADQACRMCMRRDGPTMLLCDDGV